jgi:glycosyltransferase involved in cell wall biosynthesis
MDRSLSFLIAAHNEEKIIRKTLQNLLNLPYEYYEVVIGLDGCTDGTEEIVKEFCKKSDKFRYYKLNLRQGKPAVIDEIMKHASNEIVIIHDADWIFKVKNKWSLKRFLSVFNDPKIGGIAEAFPAEWDLKKIKAGNLGYKMVAYSSYFWLEFQKINFCCSRNELLYAKEPTMFLTNAFRKKLYEKNTTLGDDFERTYDIMNGGFEIVLFDDIEMPRMTVSYNHVNLKDLVNQKVRTAIARRQLSKLGKNKAKIGNYYSRAILFMFFKSWSQGLKVGFLTLFWILIMAYATFYAGFVKSDTKESWKRRLKR